MNYCTNFIIDFLRKKYAVTFVPVPCIPISVFAQEMEMLMNVFVDQYAFKCVQKVPHQGKMLPLILMLDAQEKNDLFCLSYNKQIFRSGQKKEWRKKRTKEGTEALQTRSKVIHQYSQLEGINQQIVKCVASELLHRHCHINLFHFHRLGRPVHP